MNINPVEIRAATVDNSAAIVDLVNQLSEAVNVVEADFE